MYKSNFDFINDKYLRLAMFQIYSNSDDDIKVVILNELNNIRMNMVYFAPESMRMKQWDSIYQLLLHKIPYTKETNAIWKQAIKNFAIS